MEMKRRGNNLKGTKGKRKVKINYFKFTRSLIILIILIYLLITGTTKVLATLQKNEYQGNYNTYYVSKGETLWSIAEKQNSNLDVREIIHMIKEDNNITPELSIGQELILREIYE